MIRIDVRGLDGISEMLKRGGKQARYAAAVALTRTAKDVEAATYDEFRKVFDRPTPTTTKSLRTKTATKSDLTAKVYMKDRPLGGKNQNSMADILGHHFTGGARISKTLEFVLLHNKFITTSQRVVPGSAAKLDRYGNMNRGQIVQMLSQIGVRGSGYDSVSTKSKRSQRSVAKAGQIFWSFGPNHKSMPLVDKKTGITYGSTRGSPSRLPAGAWIRSGRTLKQILIVINGTSYRKRIDFGGIANRVVARKFNDHFSAAYRAAISTARPA